MKKVTTLFILVGFSFFISNCATIFKGDSSTIKTTSEPSGAKVYVDGNYYGDTPLKLKLKSKREYKIEFKMEGHKTITRYVTNHIGVGWIILDVILGLVPVVVDAVTGSWYSLDTDNINAILEKQQP